MRRILGYFVTGLLVVLPVVTTFALLFVAMTWLNERIFEKLGLFLSGDEGTGWPPALLGLVASLLLVTGVGFLASNFAGRAAVSLIDRLFQSVPLVKILYGSIKDLLQAFVGDKKSFDKPVLVRLVPDGSVKTVGFVTRSDLENLGITEHVAVYLPQSYNFAGNLLVVPTGQVEALSANSSDVMAFVVSGGVSGNS